MPAVRRLRRPLLALAAAALCTIVACGCGAARADLTVSGTTTSRPVPDGFVGLSMEYKDFLTYTGTNPRAINPLFIRLVQAIAPDQSPVLRIGGDSTDWSWWPVNGVAKPGGVSFSLTPTYMSIAKATAAELRAKLIMGVNLEADSRTVASAMANAIVKRVGTRYLSALELGNEPELYPSFYWYRTPSGRGVYGRPRSYDFAAYLKDYASILSGLPNVPIAGPGIGDPPWLATLGQFLRSNSRVKLTTIHAYALKHCSASHIVTIPDMLSNGSQYNFAQSIVPYVKVAKANGKQIRVDEMNAITCGGMQGVSNSFASSLWTLDTLFEMLRTGVDGVNFHTRPGSINEILGASYSHHKWSMRVHPEYYGMIMFAQAAPAGSQLLQLNQHSPTGVHTWATRDPKGDVRVTIINEQSKGAATMHVRVPAVAGNGTLERLRGPSLSALGGATLGGLGYGNSTTTGTLSGKQMLDTVAPSNGVYSITVPAGSAALLSLSPSGNPPVPLGLRATK